MRGSLFKFRFFLAFCLCLVPLLSHAVSFATHGYFRTRAEVLENIGMQRTNNSARSASPEANLVAFNQMRGRFEPMLKLNDHLSLDVQFDVLDNVVFGSQQTKSYELVNPVVGTVTLPSKTGTISLVGGNAGENTVFNFRRAYIDILTPVGKLKIGRQPSHWGLGIFQNDGNGPQDDFGDTSDRIMFATQFEFENNGALSSGILWDLNYEVQHDPRIINSFTNVKPNSQDINQYAAFVLYDQSDFSLGLFGGLRRRVAGAGTTMQAINAKGNTVWAGYDGNTKLYFVDFYGRYSYEEYSFKLEYVFLGGKMSTGIATNAIAFNSVYKDSAADATDAAGGIIATEPEQDVQVTMAAFEAAGVYNWGGEWNVKSGFAQGDANPLSHRITQYGFRPDYRIAFLMFNVPLGTSPAMWGPSSQASGATAKLAGGLPITGNFVNNTIYVSGGYEHHFDIRKAFKDCNDISVGGKVVTAWAHKNPVEMDFPTLLGNNTMPILRNPSKWYGVEADLVAEAQFYDKLFAMLEAGVLFPGAAYDSKVDTNLLGTLVETIAPQKASTAYGGRLTLMFDF